ncbi:MAG: hypothetical protein KDK91_08130 [Gammaproteobacteria bacterium]|nr:hypothetical protein [Gammaproteobacteria bacterium]
MREPSAATAAATHGPGQAALDPARVARHTLSIFPTTIANFLWPDCDALNARLCATILARAGYAPGLARSIVGGWHSALDLFDWSEPCVQELKSRIVSFMQPFTRISEQIQGDDPRDWPYRLQGWANVLSHGDYHIAHTHPNAAWSGVYYVTDNEPVAGHPYSGKLELMDPRPGASVTYAETSRLYGRFLLSPCAGQMIVFPAWLQHSVHPYFGTGQRIAVAFNLLPVARQA